MNIAVRVSHNRIAQSVVSRIYVSWAVTGHIASNVCNQTVAVTICKYSATAVWITVVETTIHIALRVVTKHVSFSAIAQVKT